MAGPAGTAPSAFSGRWRSRAGASRPSTCDPASRSFPPSASPPDSAETLGLLDELRRKVGDGDTGLALFLGRDRALAIVPPLPLTADAVEEGTAASPLLQLLRSEPLVGVVLLRLGRYAVGVLRGDRLVASKTGTRYVKSRHRAGGTSQRRFARSRERLIRELFDAACRVARDVFSRAGGVPDYVFLGRRGPHASRLRPPMHTYLVDLESRTLQRRLAVDRPGQAALDRIAREVWKSPHPHLRDGVTAVSLIRRGVPGAPPRSV